jgi:hypothetical protein
VNLKREMAENFFKLWKAHKLVWIRPGGMLISLWISKGKI